jgi:hypothetical protein
MTHVPNPPSQPSGDAPGVDLQQVSAMGCSAFDAPNSPTQSDRAILTLGGPVGALSSDALIAEPV